MTKKPVVVFDLDDTLFDTNNQDIETLLCQGIPEVVMMYNAIDYLINDPPSSSSFVFGGMSPCPVDIFFLTARNEEFRELTIKNLASLLRESPASINRRLVMGGAEPTVYRAKKECIKLLEKKGYYPVLVIDDNPTAIEAFKDSYPGIVTLQVSKSIAVEE